MWVSYCAKSCGFCYGISIILEIFEIFYNEIFYCTNLLSHQTLLQYIFHINYCNNSNVIVMIFLFFFFGYNKQFLLYVTFVFMEKDL